MQYYTSRQTNVLLKTSKKKQTIDCELKETNNQHDQSIVIVWFIGLAFYTMYM